ncbi:MAG: hypothetical protein EON55_01875 [Alphaproteobacteria bacterium]|nr:MAG: hypothetical protein EON55_01875 [Alphaproteobacteria bacterium]
MIPGQAYVDVPVIDAGFPRKEATLVSSAGSEIDVTLLSGELDELDPEPLKEQQRAEAARVAASQYVTKVGDAEARRRDPADIVHHEGIVAIMERDRRTRPARCANA